MLRPDFLLELFRLAKQDGLTALIDSNGTIPFQKYPELLEICDGVMLDIKAFHDEDHRHITDSTNQTVLENAVYLAEQGKLFEVRCVIVPDLYDTEKSIRDMAVFLGTLSGKTSFPDQGDCLPPYGSAGSLLPLPGAVQRISGAFGGHPERVRI